MRRLVRACVVRKPRRQVFFRVEAQFIWPNVKQNVDVTVCAMFNYASVSFNIEILIKMNGFFRFNITFPLRLSYHRNLWK